jgi:hypothetical protein
MMGIKFWHPGGELTGSKAVHRVVSMIGKNERNQDITMKMHMLIRRIAGGFILGSLALAHFHSPHWLWFTAFVGFNLIQSSFTNFCPLEILLKKAGVADSCGVSGVPEAANKQNEK